MRNAILLGLVTTAISIASHSFCHAQEAETTTQEIESLINHYFGAISNRNAPAVREVLNGRFIGIDAVTRGGNKNARIDFVDTTDDSKLLPPEGNDDFVGFQVSSLNVQITPANSAVALASFEMSRDLTENELERFIRSLEALNERPLDEAGKAGKEMIEKWVSEKKLQLSMFAMLGRQNDEWKIISMVFPE